MIFFRQIWALTQKNLLIAWNRHVLSTVLRAFLLPLGLMIFLSYAKNVFVPPSIYGIGSPHPIRTLAQGLDATTGGRNTIAFVNSGHSGGHIDRVIDDLAQQASAKKVVRLDDEVQLLETCRSSLRGATSCYGAAVFISSPTEGNGGIWNWTLRADGSLGQKFDVNKDTNDVQLYLLPLQRAVDLAIARVNTTIEQAAIPTMVYEYSYTSISQAQRDTNIRTNFHKAIINVLGVAFLVPMVGVTYHLTGFIATERELGMSQLIEAMMPNLQRWQPQAARMFSYHIAFDIIYMPGWIIMSIPIAIGVFKDTSMAIVIIYHVLSGLSLTSLSILGASFFKKSQLSGISAALISLLLGVLAQVLDKYNTATATILSLLFAPCTYVYFLVFMARYERQDVGTDLLHAAPENPWRLPGIVLWLFMILQIFVYPLLGAAIERGLYGTRSKGGGRIIKLDDSSDSSQTSDAVQLTDFTKIYRPPWLYRMFPWLTTTRKLPVVAVDRVSFSAKKGQILILLGANGSGKSTSIDCIAGMNSVTSGSIIVDSAGGLGIAPQKNVLWDDLTIEEHIRFFNRIKSPMHHSTAEEIKSLVNAVDLDRKSGAKAKTLSGGQKRKLQLGMMFTGGSSVCCVDEVSSGLDPLSRRKIWDILLAERGTRTIIMTTHFLDEADVLADEIVLLSKGTLRAKGSSAQLKDLLGGGYRIHLQDAPGRPNAPHIAKIPSQITFGQTVYVASTSQEAAHVIKRLEEEGCSGYQLSGPTIEDVFLQIADEVRLEYDGSKAGSLALPPSGASCNGNDGPKDIAAARPIGSKESRSKYDAPPLDSLSTQGNFQDRNSALYSNAKPVLDLHTGRDTGFFHQARVLFRKRIIILRRNSGYLPYTAAFLIPVIAAGLVTLLLNSYDGAGCAPSERISISDIKSLYTPQIFDIVAGPTSRFSNAILAPLFAPLVPSLPITSQQLQVAFNFVNNSNQFNDYINQNFANVTPGGLFLGDGSANTFLSYRANGDIATGVFAQNLLDVLSTNISISTSYSSFDIPWLPSTGKSLQMVVYFGLSMAVYPAFFALYPTLERLRNIRSLEYSNSVRPLPLWLAYVAFDFTFVLVSSAFSVAIFAASLPSLWYHIGYLYIIFFLFGLDSIMLSYVVSLFAHTPLAAFAVAAASQAILFFLYLTGYLLTLTYAPIDKIDSTLLIVHFTISVLSPMGSLIRALFVALNIFAVTCAGNELAKYPGGMLQYGGSILYLALQAFVLFAILLWYDSGSVVAWHRRLQKRRRINAQTDLPTHEELAHKTIEIDSSNDGLRVLNLTKSYGHLTAVENVSFEVKRGEVFSLLGPNGAGKSTTISLIRGDMQPSKNGGEIYVENININKHSAQARSHLGVCPQFDAMDQMTVLEHLQFYARIRGVMQVEHNVQAVIKAVGLQAFSSRMAAKLSGGNKRKLSLGIALIGNPTVLLLDEPSSGMDAAAKRVMWRTLSAVVPGRCLLLTTHSMEEADALANRAGIMAKRMLAMGTTNHLKQLHGDTYHIHLVMKSAPHTTTEETSKVRSWITDTFPNAIFEDRSFHGQIRFSVPARRTGQEKSTSIESTDEVQIQAFDNMRAERMGALITILENHRDSLGLEHYSVNPTSLDQVFLTIVGKHNVEEENYARPERKSSWYNRLPGLRKR